MCYVATHPEKLDEQRAEQWRKVTRLTPQQVRFRATLSSPVGDNHSCFGSTSNTTIACRAGCAHVLADEGWSLMLRHCAAAQFAAVSNLEYLGVPVYKRASAGSSRFFNRKRKRNVRKV